MDSYSAHENVVPKIKFILIVASCSTSTINTSLNLQSTTPGISKELLMTLIVVIYLRSVMANRKSSWSRIGEKADGYIASNIGDNGQFTHTFYHLQINFLTCLKLALPFVISLL